MCDGISFNWRPSHVIWSNLAASNSPVIDIQGYLDSASPPPPPGKWWLAGSMAAAAA